MNNPYIKPCPFCGSKRVEAFSQDEDDCPNQSAIVRCFDCEAQSAQMVGENKIQMAINAWNKRQAEPVVPADVIAALQKIARIRIDLNDFDGDRRGISESLGEAEKALIEVVNRRAAILQGDK